MFCPINLKTEYTLLTSLIRVPSLITYAKENHIQALTITDDNLSGAMEFYKACKKEQIKPIIGLDILLGEHHVLLYAKQEVGYQNLMKLSTIQSERMITVDDLEIYGENLICVIPFSSRTLDVDLNKIYPQIYYGYETLEERNQLDVKKKMYCREILGLKESEMKYLPYLEAIRRGILVREVETVYQQSYLKLENVLQEEFSSLDDLSDFVSQIDLTLTEHHEILLPTYPCPEGYETFSYLKKLCIEGLRKRFGNTVRKAYVDRLKYELSVIEKMGFSN